jgi:hypothetical protein
MKLKVALLVLFTASTVFAKKSPHLDSYECGTQVGKAVIALTGTNAENDINNLATEIGEYLAQVELINTFAPVDSPERNQVLYTASITHQAIQYSILQIQSKDAAIADQVKAKCGL